MYKLIISKAELSPSLKETHLRCLNLQSHSFDSLLRVCDQTQLFKHRLVNWELCLSLYHNLVQALYYCWCYKDLNVNCTLHAGSGANGWLDNLGFGRNNTGSILVLAWSTSSATILERSWEFTHPVHMCFVDFEKVCNRVHWGTF